MQSKNLAIIFLFFSFLFTPPSIFAHPIIAQYFGIWSTDEQDWKQKLRPDTPFEKFNRIYIAFAKIIKKPDGHFSIDYDGDATHAQDIIDRVKSINPQTEVFISLAGDGSAQQFGGAAHDDQFAANVTQFLIQYRLDGIDIDWELTLNRNDLNTVIIKLANALHPNFKLTLAVWPNPVPAYDMQVLKENLDQINIMSYGRFLTLESCVNKFVNLGFPIEKLIGGVETEVPYNEQGGTDTLGVEGSIAQKARFALSHGLAGMMGWRLDNDYHDENNKSYPTYKGAYALSAAMVKKEIDQKQSLKNS